MSKYKGFRINIKNAHLALLSSDTEDSAVYEKPEHIPGMMSISMTPQLAEGSLYGDGVVRDKATKTTSHEITIEHNKIDYSVLSKYTGKQIVDGVLIDSSTDQSPYFALGYEVELRGNKKELLWFPKCTIAPAEKSMEQSTDNINYSTDSFTITAMPLDFNGDLYYLADTSDEEMKTPVEVVEKWFDEVYIKSPNINLPEGE